MRSVSIALGVSRRGYRKLLKNPAPALPPMMIPLFMFAAFAGALSALSKTKGFDYYDYTAFVFVFVLFMSSMFVGAFSSFEIAADYEAGMGNRLMLSAPRRMAIIAGYLLFAVGRFLLAMVVIWGIALLVGMDVRGGPLDIAGIVALALLLSLATALYGTGIALRLQSVAAGTLILIPVFMALFLSPVFLPRHELSGWLETVAGVNPLTAPLEAGRGMLAKKPESVALAFGVCGGLVILFFLFAIRGMVKAERGPGGSPRRGPRRKRA